MIDVLCGLVERGVSGMAAVKGLEYMAIGKSALDGDNIRIQRD